VLVASRKYLDANGSPRRIEDLQHHAALLFRMPTSGRTLRPTPTPVLAVYPGARLVPPRVRAFVNELKALAL
jgi:hypothetical protein